MKKILSLGGDGSALNADSFVLDIEGEEEVIVPVPTLRETGSASCPTGVIEGRLRHNRFSGRRGTVLEQSGAITSYHPGDRLHEDRPGSNLQREHTAVDLQHLFESDEKKEYSLRDTTKAVDQLKVVEILQTIISGITAPFEIGGGTAEMLGFCYRFCTCCGVFSLVGVGVLIFNRMGELAPNHQ